ncbi:alpha/beta hydrolase [Paraburkholderia diazotrophica]|uniref:alpha/beta hydrolase n=1 Tax=Paraburkholderia diazotrophica TaxID=667676 RepID=UPI00317C75B6
MSETVRLILLSLLAVVLAGYAIVVALLFWLQGRLVYPLEQIRRVPPNAAADRIEPVTVRTADGLELPGRYAPASRHDAFTVVLFHGNGEDLSQRAQIAHDLIAAGHGVYLAEYRGYGGAPGHPSEAGLYADGRAALDFVAQRTNRIAVHGFSLGTGIAVRMASEYEALVALILEAPFTCIADVAKARFPMFAFRCMVRDRYDNLASIGRVRAPVLICGGLADAVIPPVQFARLYAAVRAPRRLEMIDGAGHVDVWEQGARERVLRFLDDLRRVSTAAETGQHRGRAAPHDA